VQIRSLGVLYHCPCRDSKRKGISSERWLENFRFRALAIKERSQHFLSSLSQLHLSDPRTNRFEVFDFYIDNRLTLFSLCSRSLATPLIKLFVSFQKESHESMVRDKIRKLRMLPHVAIKLAHQLSVSDLKEGHGNSPLKNFSLYPCQFLLISSSAKFNASA